MRGWIFLCLMIGFVAQVGAADEVDYQRDIKPLFSQKCGVCHGNVAFPVSDCRRCHSRPKTKEQLRALAKKSAWHGKQAGQTSQ